MGVRLAGLAEGAEAGEARGSHMRFQLTRQVISRWVMPRYWYSKDVAAKTFTVKFVFIDTVILCQGGRLPSHAASRIPAVAHQTPLALHRRSSRPLPGPLVACVFSPGGLTCFIPACVVGMSRTPDARRLLPSVSSPT